MVNFDRIDNKRPRCRAAAIIQSGGELKRSVFTGCVLIIFALAALMPAAGMAESQGVAAPSLINALDTIGPLRFCDESVPLADAEVRERMEKELLLSLGDPPQVVLWLKRSKRYLPIIATMLRDHGLPDDLKYIAVAESALRPHVGSPKGAIGFWQFMPQTGRNHGLTINEHIDERRNIYASTRAAIRYFSALYAEFKKWSLVAAAFNMGEEGLKAEIIAQSTADYYRLYLPLETQRFLFRILAVKLILGDPGAYGYHLKEDKYYPPLKFDQVSIDCFRETPILLVAQAAQSDFKRIKTLNPELRGHYLAPGKHRLRVPPGAGKGINKRFRELAKKFAKLRKERIYIVQPGDNLSTIAAKFNVPLAVLIIWNRLDLTSPIHPGDRLVIYPHRLP